MQRDSARYVIGVTGARRLDDGAVCRAAVRSVLTRIQDAIAAEEPIPRLVVLTPLAEGADRLVAREVLDVPRAELHVVLPMAVDEYIEDFETHESRAEFEKLYTRAQRTSRIEAAPSRAEAYELVGRFVVDHCNVLIAIWDGTPAAGRGGTAEIVDYARKRGCPLYWIDTERKGHVVFEPGAADRSV